MPHIWIKGHLLIPFDHGLEITLIETSRIDIEGVHDQVALLERVHDDPTALNQPIQHDVQ